MDEKKKFIIIISSIIAVVIIAILFTIVFLSINNNKGNDNKKEDEFIELSLDNYKKYIDIEVKNMPYGNKIKPKGLAFYCYDSVATYVKVKGVSSNYNYNDMVITIKSKGTCDGESSAGLSGLSKYDIPFENDIEIECDVSGSGEGANVTNMPMGYYTYDKSINGKYEVVSIKGKLKPIK